MILGVAPRAHAAFPGANGKIAFQTNRDGNYEIYSMNADGASQTRLTNNAANDLEPAWSPDGTKIAFHTNRDGNYEIYSMNADGTSQTRLTNNAAADLEPAWSPDGTKIAFVTSRDGNDELYSMNADGSSQTRLTNNAAVDQEPAWSPDGTKIAFVTNRGGNYEIYTMNASGTSPANLTTNPAEDRGPAWSPDASKVAFARRDPFGNFQIWTMKADGTSQTQFPFAGQEPAWSPDGTKIAFEDSADIWSINATGSNEFLLTNNPADDSWPDWQPLQRSYARPRGATPLRVPFTPAYKPCTQPNTTHKASLSLPSCDPPTPESSFLTVGTPDFNGVGANSIGSVAFKVRTTPEDGLINVSLTDVRCQGTSGGCGGGPLSDYSGDLRLETSFRITDKANGSANLSGTVTDLPLRVRVPCTQTASTTVGSTCSISTTKNTLFGGSAIVAGQRAIWQLSGDLKLYDGGPTGVSGDPNATLFAVGGLFYP